MRLVQHGAFWILIGLVLLATAARTESMYGYLAEVGRCGSSVAVEWCGQAEYLGYAYFSGFIVAIASLVTGILVALRNRNIRPRHFLLDHAAVWLILAPFSFVNGLLTLQGNARIPEIVAIFLMCGSLALAMVAFGVAVWHAWKAGAQEANATSHG